jgi:hypothetical protein
MNTTKELQTLTKFIQSTYTEMDLKIDEVKKQLKKDYEDKLIFHKQKHEELLKEWFNDETKNFKEGTIILTKSGWKKELRFGVITLLDLQQRDERDYSYNYPRDNSDCRIVITYTPIGSVGILKKTEGVVLSRLSLGEEEVETPPSVVSICHLSDLSNLCKKFSIPTKLCEKTCEDLHYELYEEKTNGFKVTKDIMKKYGLS